MLMVKNFFDEIAYGEVEEFYPILFLFMTNKMTWIKTKISIWRRKCNLIEIVELG